MLTPNRLNKLIEFGYLLMAWISVLTCLIRTDYNFPFALFSYYFWITKSYQERSKPLIIIAGVLILFDVIWFTTVGENWTMTYYGADIWNSMLTLRIFAFTLSIVNTLIKFVLIGLIFLFSKGLSQAGNIYILCFLFYIIIISQNKSKENEITPFKLSQNQQRGAYDLRNISGNQAKEVNNFLKKNMF